jgi:hypothetical protein
MCYESLLGLKDCTLTDPITGLYIDTLGITSPLLDQFITSQYQTGVELFEDKRSLAWRKISSDFISRLSPMMKADTIIDSMRIGQVLTNSSNVDPALGAGNYGGIRVKIDPNSSSFLAFNLSDFSIAIPASSVNTSILVFDMTTGLKIDTFTYAVGSVDQYINKNYFAKRRKADLAFVYESLVDTYRLTVKKGSCTDCGGNIKDAHICPFVDASGIQLTTDGTTILSSNVAKYTQGMSLVYNVNCDRESWLCSIGSLLSLVLAYGTAVEIYDYALTISPTKRVNTAVSVTIDQLTQARSIAADKYNIELQTVLQNMRLPNDVHCFDCQRNIKYITALP